MGLVYASQSLYTQVIETYQQGLKVAREIGDRSIEVGTISSIAEVYLNQSQYAQALKSYNAALAKAKTLGNPNLVGTTLHNIGEVNRRQGNYDRAIAAYEKGLTITREVGNRAIEGTTLHNIGEINRLQGNHDRALKSYQQALTILQQVNKSGEGQTLTNIGFTLFKARKLKVAQQSVEKAIATTESLRPGLSDANKVSIFDTQAGVYTILQQILIARDRPEAALKVSERGRSRALLE